MLRYIVNYIYNSYCTPCYHVTPGFSSGGKVPARVDLVGFFEFVTLVHK